MKNKKMALIGFQQTILFLSADNCEIFVDKENPFLYNGKSVVKYESIGDTMDIKLSNILSVPAKVYEEDVPIERDSLEYRGYEYEIVYKTPVHIKIANLGDQKLHLKADFEIHLNVPCDRCLKDVLHKFPVSVDRRFDFRKGMDDEELDDANFIEGYNLDVDMLVYEEVLVRLPMKNLCKEDCKGICSVCGADLNYGECGCDRKVPDPRMSDVLDIFNNFKEV